MSIDSIQEKNKDLEIKSIKHKDFSKYGEIVSGFDFKEGLEYILKSTEIPVNGNVYIAGDDELERVVNKEHIELEFYAQMPCQVGFCNGNNSKLNGLEYHKGSELLVAATDLVLLFGSVSDINNKSYDSSMIEAFYLNKGDSIEIYGTTLHFAPCKVNDIGFKSIIILPIETNCEISKRANEMIFAKNKWLLIHEEAKALREKGALVGINGKNIEIKY